MDETTRQQAIEIIGVLVNQLGKVVGEQGALIAGVVADLEGLARLLEGKSIYPHCVSCGEEIRGTEDSLCGKCAN